MARLDAADRATLPDSAFAYVDSRGRRRLPIHDASHVRNALARFNQAAVADEAARDRARTRLLKAARKYRIVPVGFIAAQLRSERARSALGDPAPLPSGFVTLLMTDVEGSTALLQRLGERYGKLIDGTRALLTDAVSAAGGLVVDWRADDFFAAFETPRAGLEAAVAIHRSLRQRSPGDHLRARALAWRPHDFFPALEPPRAGLEAAVAIQRSLRERSRADDLRVRVRAGIHSGYPTLRGAAYIGLAVHTRARAW